jgi:hypothetical protein
MNRSAIIVTESHTHRTVVQCYESNTLITTIDVSDHSQYYAEDTAENWETGIIP